MVDSQKEQTSVEEKFNRDIMSTLLDARTAPSQPLPPKVSQRLQAVRDALRSWFLVEGFGRLFLTALAVGAISFLLDFTFHLDLAQRSLLLLIMIGTLLFALAQRLVKPLSAVVSDDALILEVEKQHPALSESLISAVQFTRLGDNLQANTSRAMVQATIEKGYKLADPLNFPSVLNTVSFRNNLLILLLSLGLIFSIAAVGWAGNPYVTTWFKRNILLQKAFWPQKTYLQILREENGVLRIARGDDYTLQVEVTADSSVVPDRVLIDFRDNRDPLAMKKVDFTPSGEQPALARFEAVLANVIQPFDLRVRGGDAVSDYVHVELVEPPALETMTLEVTLPKYAGGSTETLPPGKGPYFILPGSTLQLAGVGNKPLSAGALVRDTQSFPFTVSEKSKVALALAPRDLETGVYVIDLVDSNGLQAKRPASFGLRMRADREPRVRARLMGIGGMVTAKARLPIACRVTDDYGLTKVHVEYRWRGDNEEKKEGAGQLPLAGAKLTANALEAAWDDLLELEPLAIPTGTGLEFYVAAADNDDFPDAPNDAIPDVGRCPDFSVRVVTDDELRSDLLRREKEQRQEFERLVKLQDELLTLNRELDAQLGQSQEFAKDQKDRLAQAPKNQKLIDTNSASIATRLGSIVVEIENNRLEDVGGPLQTRLTQKILEPLQALQTTHFPEAVKRWEAARRATGDMAARRQVLQASIEQQELVVKQMKEILEQMAQAEGFQEAVNLLYELQKAQLEVLERTKKSKEEREKEILEGAGKGTLPAENSSNPK
jgi:hypothetical protein